MLYIIRKGNREYQWHVGDKKPEAMTGSMTSAPFDDVIEIQADGHELNLIRQNFKNLPDCDKAVVSWKGDWAQFIYDHLC